MALSAPRQTIISKSLILATVVTLFVFTVPRLSDLSPVAISPVIEVLFIFLALFCLMMKLAHDRIQQKVTEKQDEHDIKLRAIESLSRAVFARDQIEYDHLRRVQNYAMGLARFCKMSVEETEALRAASLLFDVGKLAVPDYILHKPDKLTPAEYEKMKIHTVVGEEIVNSIGFPWPVAPIVRHHHERWDGAGYPDRLRGEQIPIGARIIALVTSYDAMTNGRPWQQRRTHEEAIESLINNSDSQFDPQLVSKFIHYLAETEQQALAEQSVASIESNVSTLKITTSGEQNVSRNNIYLERIRAANREFNVLYRMAQNMAGSLELPTTLGIIHEQLRSLVFFDTCVIYLMNPNGKSATAAFTSGFGEHIFAQHEIRCGSGITGWVLEYREHFYNSDPSPEFQVMESLLESDRDLVEQLRNHYVFPLIKDQEMLGAVALYSRTADRYSTDHIHLIEMATPLVSEAVNNAICYARREADALTDELTGLANSRAMKLVGEKMMANCRRNRRPLTVLMMDLDRFKQVNDNHGHRMGSQMLSELGPIISHKLRNADFLARYGGDEFFAILPDTTREQAQIVIRRIMEGVSAHQMFTTDGQTVSVGISIGAAEFMLDGETLEELIVKADLEMYSFKSRHRLENILLEEFEMTSASFGIIG
jgi:diguanylate cyclase (GGDEF)-like protein/putative nucleotidyltransferase with HDIG domain